MNKGYIYISHDLFISIQPEVADQIAEFIGKGKIIYEGWDHDNSKYSYYLEHPDFIDSYPDGRYSLYFVNKYDGKANYRPKLTFLRVYDKMKNKTILVKEYV